MKWRLLDTGEDNAYMNMALDEALFTEFVTRKIPVLRFYTWSPPALSIGYFQKISRINQNYCEEVGIDLVRRPTGGRAVLHDHELTYSFVHSTDNLPTSISRSYRDISGALVRGLKGLGLPAKLSRVEEKGNTPACFDSPAQYEVLIKGKKVIGSAQIRKKGVLLQQGSIPLSVDTEVLLSLFKIGSTRFQERAKRILTKNAGGLLDFMRDGVELKDIKKAIMKGFEDKYEIKLIESSITKKEKDLAEDLYHRKYATENWVNKR